MKRSIQQRGCAHGMTLLEVLVCIFVLLFVFFVVFVIPHARSGKLAVPQLKDSSQMRGVLQALILFAQNNGDQYPLPSAIDIDDNTVPELGTAKDTSANIYSLLMWNGLVTRELLVSPVETGNVKVYQGYELSSPQAAANPAKALWDPAFRADFTGKEPGGVSYAHMLPGGTRLPSWGNTFKATEVAIANRGPKVRSVAHNVDGSIASINADKNSVTYQFHSPLNSWSGNIGYKDNHVKFEQTMSPKGITYQNAQGKEMVDTIFYDEPDDPAGTNAFLSLFITAGDNRSDFTAIWD